MRTCFEVVCDNEAVLQELHEEGEELVQPQLDPGWMRHGDYPMLKPFGDVHAELHFIVRKTRHLLASGYLPGDIGILHRKQWGLGRYSNALRAAGPAAAHLREDKELPQQAIVVRTMHLAKSLEYRVIFVGQLQCLFDTHRPLSPADRATFAADELRPLHVGMARARDTLYLTYQSRLPTEVADLKRFLDAARSGAHGVPRESGSPNPRKGITTNILDTGTRMAGGPKLRTPNQGAEKHAQVVP